MFFELGSHFQLAILDFKVCHIEFKHPEYSDPISKMGIAVVPHTFELPPSIFFNSNCVIYYDKFTMMVNFQTETTPLSLLTLQKQPHETKGCSIFFSFQYVPQDLVNDMNGVEVINEEPVDYITNQINKTYYNQKTQTDHNQKQIQKKLQRTLKNF